MTALASALHPVVNSTPGTQWGHRLECCLWSTQEPPVGLLHILPRPWTCSNPRGEERCHQMDCRGCPGQFRGHSFHPLVPSTRCLVTCLPKNEGFATPPGADAPLYLYLNQVALSDTFILVFNSRKSVFSLEERART